MVGLPMARDDPLGAFVIDHNKGKTHSAWNASMTTLLTLEEAAARLKSTTDQVVGFVHDGTLKYINVGRGKLKPRYRFDPTDIADFIDAHRTREEPACRSTNQKNPRHTIGLTSSSGVVGFMARRDAQLARTPKSLS
jgi:hypothetical protein